MNAKILIVVLLAVSLMFVGCAKRGGETPANVSQNASGAQTSGTQESDIGGLFSIDTDKPMEGTGYQVPADGEQ
ncbi:hypothetical protein H0O01_05310 [Candidatus Micrarchaeota archaeon]|nr:hypothetical protein [Candidatus Micrarchaeota archaeon]